MTLPAIPSQLVGRDYLAVGGGYGTVAAGTSPAGGMSVDNAGHAALNGDFTIDGALSVGGLVKQWERYVSAVVGMADLTNTPVGPVQTAWGTRISTHTIDYHPTTFKDAHFRIALPASYDGRALAFQLLWGAQAGPPGASSAGKFAGTAWRMAPISRKPRRRARLLTTFVTASIKCTS